jgi:hypothetical protein
MRTRTDSGPWTLWLDTVSVIGRAAPVLRARTANLALGARAQRDRSVDAGSSATTTTWVDAFAPV